MLPRVAFATTVRTQKLVCNPSCYWGRCAHVRDSALVSEVQEERTQSSMSKKTNAENVVMDISQCAHEDWQPEPEHRNLWAINVVIGEEHFKFEHVKTKQGEWWGQQKQQKHTEVKNPFSGNWELYHQRQNGRKHGAKGQQRLVHIDTLGEELFFCSRRVKKAQLLRPMACEKRVFSAEGNIACKTNRRFESNGARGADKRRRRVAGSNRIE